MALGAATHSQQACRVLVRQIIPAYEVEQDILLFLAYLAVIVLGNNCRHRRPLGVNKVWAFLGGDSNTLLILRLNQSRARAIISHFSTR